MNNPWKKIALSDYENHMSLDSVYQLQTMNQMMKEQFSAHNSRSLMILGIAGGNGLEHIRQNTFDIVYGVDINEGYLSECKKRYPTLSDIFHTLCIDLMKNDISLPHVDLLIANLLIEYIGYAHFKNVIQIVKPHYISCIIQLNTNESFVSDSPYLHAFDRLDEVHHQIDESTLINAMQEIGYTHTLTTEKALPNGKKLIQIDFSS